MFLSIFSTFSQFSISKIALTLSLDGTFAEKFIFLLSTRGDFEECQTIFYEIKKETLTVIVSACKILYSFFSGKIIPVFICSIVQTCKLFYCKIFQWIFFIYHNSYSIFSNDFCFQKLCFIIL